MPSVLLAMCNADESVATAANFVLQLLNANYGSDKLIRTLLLCLNTRNLLQVKLRAFNEILVIITDEDTHCAKANVEFYVRRIAERMSGDKEIALPALNVLLALRDENREVTTAAVMSLPEKQLELIQKLTARPFKDPQNNLASYRTVQEEAVPGPINESRNGQKSAARPGSILRLNKPKEMSCINSVDILRNLLASSKDVSVGDVEKLLKAICEVAHSSQKEFWNSFILQTLDFLFLVISDEAHQRAGFGALKALIIEQTACLLPHTERLIKSIAHCFSLSRKTWESTNDLCKTLTAKFSLQITVPILIKNIVREEESQEFIRCLSAVIRSSEPSAIPAKNIVNVLRRVN